MSMQLAEVAKLDRDGFVVLDGVLPQSEVERARQDFDKLFQRDLDARRENGVAGAHYPDGPLGYTILTEPSHLALDVYNKSETFDRLVAQMLGNPKVCQIMEAWSGPSYRIGSVNIRYMTGAIDPPPSHELHRDSPGSMNLCIMLTDVEPGDNGATALVSGSHWAPVDPRWDCLFEGPFRLRKDPSRSGLSFFLRWNLFNRMYKAKALKTLTGAFGKQGSVYFFPNGEIWHGRLPNMHGRRAMICLMGCRAVDAELAATPSDVAKDVLAKLPPRFAKGLGGPFEINDPTNTIRERLYKTRRPGSFFSLGFWSKLERRCAEWISDNAFLRRTLEHRWSGNAIGQFRLVQGGRGLMEKGATVGLKFHARMAHLWQAAVALPAAGGLLAGRLRRRMVAAMTSGYQLATRLPIFGSLVRTTWRRLKRAP
jgi:hypothetical protein